MGQLRFYATSAPAWWPYQLVSSLTQPQLPRTPGRYYFIVDNGMFTFYRRGDRPPLDLWLKRLMVVANRLSESYRPVELAIILPDWPTDPLLAVNAARHELARRLCRDYTCYAVAHPSRGLAGFEDVASMLASIDTVSGVAAPLKLHCSRYSEKASRHIVDYDCQYNVALQVARAAKHLGVRVHGLGAALRPQHVARLVKAGLDSIDTTSWTRPNTGELARLMGHRSVRSHDERSLAFAYVVLRLARAGVDLEGIHILAEAGITGVGEGLVGGGAPATPNNPGARGGHAAGPSL